MIRLRILFWLVLVSATGFAMFGVKYQVQALEDELARINRATAAEDHEIHVLDAEWAYLTRPETLGAVNRQFLSLVAISTKQLRTTVADIPMRPAPPTPDDAATLVASADPAPLQSPPPSIAEGDTTPGSGPAPIEIQAEPSQTKSALSAMPALLEKPAAAPPPAKPAKAARPGPPRRAKSLDDLIAQIMASR
jgi:hypothetical protein